MRRLAKLALMLVALVLIAEGAFRLIGLGDPVLLQSDGRCGYVLRPNQAHFRFLAHPDQRGKHAIRADSG
jgi:hypothetical protein